MREQLDTKAKSQPGTHEGKILSNPPRQRFSLIQSVAVASERESPVPAAKGRLKSSPALLLRRLLHRNTFAKRLVLNHNRPQPVTFPSINPRGSSPYQPGDVKPLCPSRPTPNNLTHSPSLVPICPTTLAGLSSPAMRLISKFRTPILSISAR